jgi:hypothetical protein
MKRVNFSEIHEQSWFPTALRDDVTDALQFILRFGNVYECVAPRLRSAIEISRAYRVVDLCSGGGGPWMWMYGMFSRDRSPVSICLTDRFPNIAAFEHAREISQGTIDYSSEPIDASHIPPVLVGFRTIFSSFHHFSPEEASAILRDAVNKGQGIGIFEAAGRRPLNILLACLMPLAGFLTAPFVRPFRFSRLFWTYLIPVIPFVLWFDGTLSCLRCYSPAELSRLSCGPNGSGYTWEVKVSREGFVPVTYMLGYLSPAR